MAGEPITPVLVVSDDPYRPDTVLDGGEFEGLTVRAACLRGRFKRSTGDPRQDDLCIRIHGASSSLVIAVADGVTGAQRSHVGSALAVRHASANLTSQLDGTPPDQLDWSAAFQQAAWSLVEENRRESGDPTALPEAALETLATTISAVVVSRHGDGWTAHAASVGDSPALLLRGGALQPLLGIKEANEGIVEHTTTALPQLPALVPALLPLQNKDVLLVATDGWSDPVAMGHTPVGKSSVQALQDAPGIIEFGYLVDFNQRTFDDDRTLVAVWIGE